MTRIKFIENSHQEHSTWYTPISIGRMHLILILLIVTVCSCNETQNSNSMKTEKNIITGNESRTGKETPYEALVEFYDAFNNRNLKLMKQNWAHNSEVAMDNPLGGIMRGWDDIELVYQRIFEGKAKVYVEYYDYTIHQTADMFYAVGRERGHFEVDAKRITLEIRTSRIFRKIHGKWRQVHHHGSIEDPALLRAYQELVKK